MPERGRVLQLGPDPAIGGGMSTALRSLLESPLADRYELDVVPTYRRAEPLHRLLTYGGALARLCAWSLRGRGRIVHIHATVRGSMYRKAVCVLVAKGLRRRVILHIHSGAKEIAYFAGGRDSLSLRLFRAAFAASDIVLAVSVASAEALKEVYGVEGIEVVPNAAPVVPPFTRESGDEVRVAYLGGFANQIKGGDDLLEALGSALAREPRLRVTLAGPGDLPSRGSELIAAQPRLEWTGWLGPAEKDELLRTCEIFVMPSRSEGLPMALLEAMAYGMAVLATEVGGIPEVVKQGVDGRLIPAEDPEALTAALCELAADADLRERLSAGARRRVEKLDVVEVTDRLDALYTSLLG